MRSMIADRSLKVVITIFASSGSRDESRHAGTDDGVEPDVRGDAVPHLLHDVVG